MKLYKFDVEVYKRKSRQKRTMKDLCSWVSNNEHIARRNILYQLYNMGFFVKSIIRKDSINKKDK